MKVRSNNSIIKATRTFTDREEPRASFWKKYEQVKEELSLESNVHVLSYYGIGGIGKTTLLKKIIEELNERVQKPRYVYFDFNLYQESRAVLDKLRNKLSDDYGFSFPLFELGLFAYSKKIGEKADSIEVQKLTDKSPILKVMTSVLGNIPIFDLATKIFDLADEGLSIVLTHLKQHNRELNQIEYMEAEELYNYLPYLFSRDMAKNLENAKEPFVFLFDTFERVVNELSSVGEPLKNDEWIRSENGLVQNIPGVLWVIAGREKLKWERFDSDWSEALEQHILGNLSFADSNQFLVGAGVGPETLRKQLYDLTKGTPVYLDLCVDQFVRIMGSGKTPEIGMFGSNTIDLVERFARYMDASQKDLVYVLSCLQRWSDELAIDIASALLPNFSLSVYEKAKDFSFIIKSDNGYYNIHQTVGDVLLNGCPDIVKQRTADVLFSKFADNLDEDNVFSPDFSVKLRYVLRAAIIKTPDRESFRKIYEQEVKPQIKRLSDAGLFEQAKAVLELAHDKAKEQTDLLYASVTVDNSIYESTRGNYQVAIPLAEQAADIYEKTLGREDDDTIKAFSNLADTLTFTQYVKRAYELDNLVYSLLKEKYGEEHEETVTALCKLSVTSSLIGNDDETFAYREKALKLCLKVLGEDHNQTLKAKTNFAIVLQKRKRTEEAYKLRLEVYEKRKETLGENHLETIRALSNLANTLSAMGNKELTRKYREEVVEKRRQILGEYHRETLQAKNNLANILCDMGEHLAAFELRKEVFEKRKEMFGDNHRDTASAAGNLALSYEKLERYEEELETRKYVYEKYSELLGENYLDTVYALEFLGDAYGRNGDKQNQIKCYEELIVRYKQVLGENHRYRRTAIGRLAELYWPLGEYTRVKELEEELLRLRIEALGEDDMSTVDTMRNLSITLLKFKEYDRVLELKKKVFDKRVEHLGFDHEKTKVASEELKNILEIVNPPEKSSLDDLSDLFND